MSASQFDPVDHTRTTRPHAGESMKDGRNAPGLLALAAAVVLLVASLFQFATGRGAAGAGTLLLTIIAGALGTFWIVYIHRRVRREELGYLDTHPQVPEQPPNS
jgi:protein-S-isoprenylcysteine O-methyltransferase Ste14